MTNPKNVVATTKKSANKTKATTAPVIPFHLNEKNQTKHNALVKKMLNHHNIHHNWKMKDGLSPVEQDFVTSWCDSIRIYDDGQKLEYIVLNGNDINTKQDGNVEINTRTSVAVKTMTICPKNIAPYYNIVYTQKTDKGEVKFTRKRLQTSLEKLYTKATL